MKKIMEPSLRFTMYFLIAGVTFTSCKKEKDVSPSMAPVVNGSTGSTGAAKQYDLDITVTSNFSFLNNYNNPWDYGAPSSDGYYDLTEIIAKGVIPPLGEFDIYISEYADTAELSDSIIESYVQISQGHVNPLYIIANSSINFKKLIRQGGGPLNGTFTITAGSTQQCDANVLTNLPPLTITGNLDVNNHVVTLGIKGKVCF